MMGEVLAIAALVIAIIVVIGFWAWVRKQKPGGD
jgi:hypothetical protein